MCRELLGIARNSFWQGISSPYGNDKIFARRLQNACASQYLEHPAEQTAVFIQDSQALPQIFGVHGGARLPLPSEFLQGRERKMPRHAREVRQPGGPQSGIDSFRCQVVGEQLPPVRNLSRTREEIRWQQSRRKGAFAPHDLVEQFLNPFHCREQRRPRRALHHESAQFADQDPTLVVEKKIPHEDLRRPTGFGIRFPILRSLPHAHVAEKPIR